ncbi:hypothetical protein H9W95_13465 [Flavobacterium lindanitolerans]|nr:hypothetical protein [Flavobacterium lindanitolerans]
MYTSINDSITAAQNASIEAPVNQIVSQEKKEAYNDNSYYFRLYSCHYGFYCKAILEKKEQDFT